MTARRVQEVLGLIQKNLECSICLELLKNPVSTRCDHQFCRFCIAEFLQTKSSAPCPLCKKPVTKRSLQEREDLKHIVDNIRELFAAFQEDSGTVFTPPKGPRISQSLQKSSDLVTVKETGLKRKNVRRAPVRRLLESPKDGSESTNTKPTVEAKAQNIAGGQNKYSDSCTADHLPRTASHNMGDKSVQPVLHSNKDIQTASKTDMQCASDQPRIQTRDINRCDLNEQNPLVENKDFGEQKFTASIHSLKEQKPATENLQLNEQNLCLENNELSEKKPPEIVSCQNREIKRTGQADIQPVLELRRTRTRSRQRLQQSGTCCVETNTGPLNNDTDNQVSGTVRLCTRSNKIICNSNGLSAVPKCLEEISTSVQNNMGEDLFGFIDGFVDDCLVKDASVSETKFQNHKQHADLIRDCANQVKDHENVIEKNVCSSDTLIKGRVDETKPFETLVQVNDVADAKTCRDNQKQVKPKSPGCQSDEDCLGQDAVSPVSDDDTAMPLFQSQDNTLTKRTNDSEDCNILSNDESEKSWLVKATSKKTSTTIGGRPLTRSHSKEPDRHDGKGKMITDSENDSADSQSNVSKFLKPKPVVKTYAKKKHVGKISHKEVMLKNWIDKLPVKMQVDDQEMDIVEIVPLCHIHNRVQDRVCNDVTNVLHSRSSDGKTVTMCLNTDKGFCQDLSENPLEMFGTRKRIFKSRNSVIDVPQSQIVARSECDSDPYEFKSSQTTPKKLIKRKRKRKGNVCKAKKVNKVPLHVLEKKNKDAFIDVHGREALHTNLCSVSFEQQSSTEGVSCIENSNDAKSSTSRSDGEQSGIIQPPMTDTSFRDTVEASKIKTSTKGNHIACSSILNGNEVNKKNKRRQTAKKVHWRDDGKEMSILIDKISEAEDHDILFSTQDAMEKMVPENKEEVVISVDVEESDYFDHEDDDDPCLIVRQDPDDNDETKPEATSEDPLQQNTESEDIEGKQIQNCKTVLKQQAHDVTKDKKLVQDSDKVTRTKSNDIYDSATSKEGNINQLQDSIHLERSKNLNPNSDVRKSISVKRKQNTVDVSSGITVVAETPLMGAGFSILTMSSTKTVSDKGNSTQTPVQSSVNMPPESVGEMKAPTVVSPGVIAGTPQVGMGLLGQLCSKKRGRCDFQSNTSLANCNVLQTLTQKGEMEIVKVHPASSKKPMILSQTQLTQKQKSSDVRQTAADQRQTAESQKITDMTSSSASGMQFLQDGRHEKQHNNMSAEDVQNQQSESEHEELMSSSADSSSTEDLDTLPQDIQFEVPNLDVQPEDIKIRLTQMSEDIMSYDSSNQVVSNRSDIILDVSNDRTIPESIDETKRSRSQETQPSSSGEFSDKNQMKDCVEHCSNDQERTEVPSPVTSDLNQDYSKYNNLKRNNKLKLKGKSINSKSNVESLSDEYSRDNAKEYLYSPHRNTDKNVDPVISKSPENDKVNKTIITASFRGNSCDSSVDSQASTVLSSASKRLYANANAEKTFNSEISNKTMFPDSCCSTDIVPCTGSSLTVNKSSPNKELVSCSKYSVNFESVPKELSKSSGESDSTIFQTSSDQSVSILAPVSLCDIHKGKTPDMFECSGNQALSSSGSHNGNKKDLADDNNIKQSQSYIDDKHSGCVKNLKEHTSSGTARSLKRKRKCNAMDGDGSFVVGNTQNIDNDVDSSNSVMQCISSSTDSVCVISSNDVINNHMQHQYINHPGCDEDMNKDLCLETAEMDIEKPLSRKLRSSLESSRSSGKRTKRKQIGVVKNSNNSNVVSGESQSHSDIRVSSGKPIVMSSVESPALTKKSETQSTADADSSQCDDVLRADVESSLCRKLRSVESSRSSGQKRKRKQKGAVNSNSSYRDVNELEMTSEKNLPASEDGARILTTPSHLQISSLVSKFNQVNSDPIPLVRDASDEEILQVRRPKRRCFSLDGSPVKPPDQCCRSRRTRNVKTSHKQNIVMPDIDRNICSDKEARDNPDVMMGKCEEELESCNKMLNNSEMITEIPETMSDQRSLHSSQMSVVALSPDSNICTSSFDTVVPSVGEIPGAFAKKINGLQDRLNPNLAEKDDMHDELSGNSSIIANKAKGVCDPKSVHINTGGNHNNIISQNDIVCTVENMTSKIVESVLMKDDDPSEEFRKRTNGVKLKDDNVADADSVKSDDHGECGIKREDMEQSEECVPENVQDVYETQLSPDHQYSLSQDIFQKDFSSSEHSAGQFSQDSVKQIGCENVTDEVPVTYNSSSDSEENDRRLKSRRKSSRTVRGIASGRKSGSISTASSSSIKNVSKKNPVVASPSETCPTLNFSPCSGQSKEETGSSSFILNNSVKEDLTNKSFEDICQNAAVKGFSENNQSTFIPRNSKEREQNSLKRDDILTNVLALTVPNNKYSALDSSNRILAETLRHRQLDFISPTRSKFTSKTNSPRRTSPGDKVLYSTTSTPVKCKPQCHELPNIIIRESSQVSGIRQHTGKDSTCSSVQLNYSTISKSSRKHLDKNDLEECKSSTEKRVDSVSIRDIQGESQKCGSLTSEVVDSTQSNQMQHRISKENNCGMCESSVTDLPHTGDIQHKKSGLPVPMMTASLNTDNKQHQKSGSPVPVATDPSHIGDVQNVEDKQLTEAESEKLDSPDVTVIYSSDSEEFVLRDEDRIDYDSDSAAVQHLSDKVQVMEEDQLGGDDHHLAVGDDEALLVSDEFGIQGDRDHLIDEALDENDRNCSVATDQFGVNEHEEYLVDGDQLIGDQVVEDDNKLDGGDGNCSADTDRFGVDDDGQQLVDEDHLVVGDQVVDADDDIVGVDGNCSIDTDKFGVDEDGGQLVDEESGDHIDDKLGVDVGNRSADTVQFGVDGDQFAVDDHDLIVDPDHPQCDDPVYGNLPLTSSPVEADNRPDLFKADSSDDDDDESIDIPVRSKKKRRAVIEDSDEDSDLSPVSTTNHSCNLTSSSAFSSQSEVLTTQQKVLLETDCAKLKEKIRATEAKIKDLATKTPGSVMKVGPTTDSTRNERDSSQERLSELQANGVEDGNDSTSSEDSDDLFLSPLPPTPPPPQDPAPTPVKPSAIVEEAVKILNKLRSPESNNLPVSKAVSKAAGAGLKSQLWEGTHVASPSLHRSGSGNVFENVKSSNGSPSVSVSKNVNSSNGSPSGSVFENIKSSNGSPSVSVFENIKSSNGSPSGSVFQNVNSSNGSPFVNMYDNVKCSNGSPSVNMSENVKSSNGSPSVNMSENVKSSNGSPSVNVFENVKSSNGSGSSNVFENVKSVNQELDAVGTDNGVEKSADTNVSLTKMSTVTRSKCFIATGLCKNEVMAVQNLAENNDCKFYSKFNSKVTHVIVKTVDKDHKRCDRTLKYFQGIAAKCFIVSFKWVVDSLKAGILLPEDEFEITGDSVSEEIHFGPSRSRLTTSKLFTGFSFSCVGVSTEMTKDDMVTLLKMCGAGVADDPWELGVMSTDSTKLIIRCLDIEDNPPSLSEVDFFNSHYKHLGVVTVSREWALDSIGVYQIQPLADYLLTQVDVSLLPF